MSQAFGIEAHSDGASPPLRSPIRYMVLIDAGGSEVAMSFLESHERVGEVDAAAEEVNAMIAGIAPLVGALDPVWDSALSGHSEEERRGARIYALKI